MLISKPIRLPAGQLTCFLYSSQPQTIIYVLYTVQCTLVLLKCVFYWFVLEPTCMQRRYFDSSYLFNLHRRSYTFTRKSVDWSELTINYSYEQISRMIRNTKTDIAVQTLTKFALDTKNLYKVKVFTVMLQ
jgi:hypothetical protein